MFDTFNGIYENSSQRVRYLQQYIGGNAPLITKGLLDLENGQFINEANLKLSDYSLDLLKKDGVTLYAKATVKSDDHLLPENIAEKNLFYNEEEKHQLSLLQDALDDTSFVNLQKRLTEKGLSPGVAVLLHGPPGT